MFEPLPVWVGWAALAVIGLLSFVVSEMFWKTRKETKSSYILGNRAVPWFPLAGSIAATWLASQAMFVVATQAYKSGWVGVFWFTVPNLLSLILFGSLVGFIRRKFPDGFTLSEAMARNSSVAVQRIYQVVLMAGQTLQTAVQLTAGAILLNKITGVSYSGVVIAMGVIVLAYTIRTGVKATILTDTIQIMLIILVEVLLAGWFAVVAGEYILAGFNGPGGEYTSLFSGPGLEVFFGFGLVSGLGLLFGPFNDQAFWQRAWAGKEGDIRKAFFVGALMFVVGPLSSALFGFAAGGAGMDIDPQVANVEGMMGWLPQWTLAPFAIALIASILSTMDSQLSSLAGVVGHDLTKNPENSVRNAQRAMIGLMILAIAISLTGNSVVTLFSIFAAVRMSPTGVTALVLFTNRKLSTPWTVGGLLIGMLVGVPLVAYGVITGTPMITFYGTLIAILSPGLVAWVGSKPGEQDFGKVIQEPAEVEM